MDLYRYDWNWSRLTPNNGQQEMCAAGTALYMDFGTSGLYRYDGSKWARIHTDDPTALLCYEDKVIVNFTSYGLYEYSGSWKRLSEKSCQGMVAVDLYERFW